MDISNTKNRSAYWDNIKGILIVLTVFAHFLYQFRSVKPAGTAVEVIYTFHMPAFVFVSGYFGKSERAHSFEAVIRLVFLYFIFNSLMGFIYGMDSLIVPLYSFWYLAALIAWRLTAHRIAEFRDIRLILLAAAVMAGFFDSVDNSFALARIISFYPYYMSGYLLSEEKSGELLKKGAAKRCAAGLGCLAAAGAAVFLGSKYFQYSENALLMGAYSNASGAFERISLFAIGFLMIYALRCLVPDRRIPLLTLIGKNSLWIFIFHRPITLEAQRFLSGTSPTTLIAVSAALTAASCAVLGCEPLNRIMTRFAEAGTEIFTSAKKTKCGAAARIAALLTALGFIVTAVLGIYGSQTDEPDERDSSENGGEIIYRTISAERRREFDNAFKITFAGDLILLEDQVKRAYRENGYDFSDVFEYAKDYISSADYAIGVFEGPMAGEAAGYTTSNFDDGKELYLNFPDEFAAAVKEAGFDLVTTANNHLLDKGVSGALRTQDVLESACLDYTGSYRSAEDKAQRRVKLAEKDGIRLAILSYTYGSNHVSTELLANGELSYLTSVIGGTSGELFESLKLEVERDFEAARALEPDLIAVLPHIGTQFSNSADDEQETWFGIFKELGADIILGDHPHVVEPAVIEEYNGRKVFTAYCPGNFANLYRENQGDASALIEVYIDRSEKAVMGGGIVPLYTQSLLDGNFRALPIYEIENNTALRQGLSTDDRERARRAHEAVMSVTLGISPDISAITKSCLFDENGFLRQKASGLTITDEMRRGTLYSELTDVESVCFLGDSLTEGTKNGGCPWYEPIEEFFEGKTIYNFSKGGCTIGYLLERAGGIPEAELYIIAVGANDVRYRDAEVCAMTAEEFTDRADSLKNVLLQKNGAARIVFIAPWYSSDGDPFCALSFRDKTLLNGSYAIALELYCSQNGLGFVNANPIIARRLSTAPQDEYLLDHIHPNASAGAVMYSEAVLLAG